MGKHHREKFFLKKPRIVNIERFGVWVSLCACVFVFFLFPWGDVLAVTFG